MNKDKYFRFGILVGIVFGWIFASIIIREQQGAYWQKRTENFNDSIRAGRLGRHESY